MNMNKTIPTTKVDNVELIKAQFEKHLPAEILESYRLPVKDSRAKVIVGLSGGGDSSVLALFTYVYLASHYADIELVFTDTKQEPKSCYETLDMIETLTGISLKKITPPEGLFEYIDKYNGFLPSFDKRWCTSGLKVKPLVSYIKSIENEYGYVNLAGIRVDEVDREGIQFQHKMENAKSAYPFIDLKMTKAMVFDILNNTIGIPSTYAYRSRSGCYCCFFQRNSEIIGMLQNDPDDFAKTEAYEKLTDEDSKRWDSVPKTLSNKGMPGFYPVPAFIDVRKHEKAPSKAPYKLKVNQAVGMTDMFGLDEIEPEDKGDELYVAYALFVEPALGYFGGGEFTPGTYWHEFVTVSTSLAGIKSALGNYYKFKKTTPMPQYDLKDLKIVIAQLKFPKNTIDTKPPSKKSFTWKSNVAYKQLRHLVKHAQATLEHVDLRRRLKDAILNYRNAKTETQFLDAQEHAQSLVDQLKTAPPSSGKLSWEGLYSPTVDIKNQVQLQLDGFSVESDIKPARVNLEFDEVPRACIACSI